jgi:hypothetical protein
MKKRKKIIIPTLMDVKLFLLILLIRQQYHCSHNRNGAKNLGEVLYLASHNHSRRNSSSNGSGWHLTENHYKFWKTLLSLYIRVSSRHFIIIIYYLKAFITLNNNNIYNKQDDPDK